MMDSCTKHPHEPGRGICGRCGLAWCGTCLVYAHGPKKPPYCMECAMFAAGVRSAATRPAMPRRELKKLQKAAKAKGAGRDEPATDDEAQPEPAVAAAASEVPPANPPTTDWDSPWWEEREHALAD